MRTTDDVAPSLTFGPWPNNEKKARAVLAALGPAGDMAVSQGRLLLHGDLDGDVPCRARVVRDSVTGKPVGVVGFRRLPGLLEEHQVWVHVEIVPWLRGRGLGSAALAHLTRMMSDMGLSPWGNAVTGSPAHRWMTDRGFHHQRRIRTFRVRPQAVAPVEHGYAMEWHEGPAWAPDDVKQAWWDWTDARNWPHPTPPTPMSQERRGFHGASYSPLVAARRPDGTIAGVGFLDEFPSDDSDLSGGPVDPADPDGRSIVAALLAACAEHLSVRSLLLELGDDEGDDVVAFVADHAVDVLDDKVACARL
ncbi:GNAT family N-acetyltransferase [Streptomyces triculaminicus]|uniref:GNAT family N-acetyltransferase n=1 Tax=Streptomyces triculaminicus TaxID=2816232 RepID=UPI0033E4BEBC